MIRTNGEKLNVVLDEIMKSHKNPDVVMLARRMRNDEDFAISALSFFTTVCYLHPSLLEQISRKVLMLHLKNAFEDD